MANKTLKREFLADAILNTLFYRSIFNCGISKYQLLTFLLNPGHKASFTSTDFDQTLTQLKKLKKIKQKGNIFYLYKQKQTNWLARYHLAQHMISEHAKTFRHIERITWVRLLAVTGSVAAYNAKSSDDVDIFIVCAKGRVWITRFFVVLLLKLFDVYRTDTDYVGKICPNIFIDESSLSWEKDKQSIYVAHEILLMQPIIDRDNTYLKFLKRNDWAFEYFVNSPAYFPRFSRIKATKGSLLVHFSERLLMLFQLWYMKSKKTTEITEDKKIHFNKVDYHYHVLKKFQNSKQHT